MVYTYYNNQFKVGWKISIRFFFFREKVNIYTFQPSIQQVVVILDKTSRWKTINSTEPSSLLTTIFFK